MNNYETDKMKTPTHKLWTYIAKAILAGTISCLILLAGCSTRTLKMGGATYTSKNFLNKMKVGVIEYHSGTNSLRIEAWDNDNVAGAAIIAREAAKGAVEGFTGKK